MPEYQNGELILSSAENEHLLRWLAHPDADTLNRRDSFLAEIDATIKCEEADGGVWVEFPDPEEASAMSLTYMYSTFDDDDSYKQILSDKKVNIYIKKPSHDHVFRKEKIKYSCDSLICEEAYSFISNCA